MVLMKLFRLFSCFKKSKYYHYHYSIRFGTIPPLLMWIISTRTNDNINKNKNGSKNSKSSLPKLDSETMDSMTLDSIYFPTKAVHKGVEPNANVTYNLSHSFSSIINGYKMAEVPTTKILHDLFREELDELNKFSERKIVDHKFIHSKEYMRFHVELKPFSWLENIPILNYMFNISLYANEDWIIDWKQHRAECLITNETLRWTFSVDELVIIQGINGIVSKSSNSKHVINKRNTTHTKLYKALYINTIIPIPSIMFSNYKKYSDSYINVIAKLASFRCNSSSVMSNE
eukprot:355246_1